MTEGRSVFSKLLVIRFPAELSKEPVISQAVRRYNLDFNILKAQVMPGKDGLVVMEIRAHRKDYEAAVTYFREKGIQVQTVNQQVRRNDDRCFHCGACTAVCPTGALYIDRPSMTVVFNLDKCMACAMCVTACPPRAMEVGGSETGAILV